MTRGLRYFCMAGKMNLAVAVGVFISLSFIGMIPNFSDLGDGIGMAIAVFALMIGIGVATAQMNIVLSMGETRKNYFVGIQCSILTHAIVLSLLNECISMISPENYIFNIPFWFGMIYYGTLYLFGVIAGVILIQKRIWANILFFLFAWFGWMASIFIMVGWDTDTNWGHLPIVLAGIVAIMICIAQWYLWRHVKNFCVR